ncbi:MAG TPA: hypothetical protein VGH32_08005 [Pirellulales bacterium]
MRIVLRRFAGAVLAAAILLAIGCMPRGPFPVAAFFGEGDGSGSPNGNCCGAGRAPNAQSSGGASDNGPGAPPPVAAPIANFLPVPTRPVFTPWTSDQSDAPEVRGPLAWLQAIAPAPSGNTENFPRIEERSPEPIARRLPGSSPTLDAEPLQPTPEWHAASSSK